MTPTLALKKRRYAEDQMQASIVQHLEIRKVPGLLYWHTPNSSKMGGKRTSSGVPLAAIRLKKLGLLPGVSDLCFLHEGNFFVLELKALGGRPTEAQNAFMESVRNAGGYAMWADDLNRALAILEMWNLIRSNVMVQKLAG
jgi:hypothetical protein